MYGCAIQCALHKASLALCLTWALHQVRGVGAAADAMCVRVLNCVCIIFAENREKQPEHNSKLIENMITGLVLT